jgi:AcrR family transcriptional regulator
MGHVPDRPGDHPEDHPESDVFDPDRVADVLRSVFERFPGGPRGGPVAAAEEGLRDRKKRLLRQRISDTATAMFLERGFNEVTVSEIAEACDVSEKTVFNYFPTKESLLLDREEYQAALITEALRDRGEDVSLVDGIVAVLEADTNTTYDRWSTTDDPDEALTRIRAFAELIEDTPTLQAALHGMTERLVQVAAQALAERADVDPEDPEPQLAAQVVLGLWSAQIRAMQRHAEGSLSLEDVRTAVLADIRRAARVADSGLSSFNLVVHRSSGGRQQMRDAAEAANEARKQVLAAVKQARDAWKAVMGEHKAAHHSDEARQAARREVRAMQEQLRAEIRERQRAIREHQLHETRDALQKDIRSMKEELRAVVRQRQAEIRQRQAEVRRQQAQMRREQQHAQPAPGGGPPKAR